MRLIVPSGGGGGGMAIGGSISSGTATRVLFTGAGPVLADDADFTFDTVNNRLFVPQIAGGSATSANLDLYANSNTFDPSNTGRINTKERIVFAETFSTSAAVATAWLAGTGTHTTSNAQYVFPAFSWNVSVEYSVSQGASVASAFSTSVAFKPTTNGISDSVGLVIWSGFNSGPQFIPKGVGVSATTNDVVAYFAGPKSNLESATAATVVNMTSFGSFGPQNLIADFIGGYVQTGTTWTNCRHFWARQPSGAGTIVNQIGVDLETLAGTTLTAGIRSAITSGSGKWFLLGNGTASSAHTGLFSFGKTTVPTALVDVAGSTTARSSIRVEAGTAPTAPNSGDLWHDSTKMCFMVYCGGATLGLEKVIFAQTATQTIGGTGVETTLFGSGIGTLTLPANFLSIGKTLKIKLMGHYSTKVAPVGVVDLRLKIGGTTLITYSGIPAASASNEGWIFEAMITCRTTGATGTIIGQGLLSLGEAAGAPFSIHNTATATTTVDTTGALAIDVTWDWTTSNASNTVSTTNAAVEVLF